VCDFNERVVLQEIFIKIPSIKFHANPISGNRDHTSAQTGRHTETTIALFYIYASVLKKKGQRKKAMGNGVTITTKLIDLN
jgi:hypothetical protein